MFHYNNNEQTNNRKVLSTANMFNIEQLNGLPLRAGRIYCPPPVLIMKMMLETTDASPEKKHKGFEFKKKKKTMTVFIQGMANCTQIVSKGICK